MAETAEATSLQSNKIDGLQREVKCWLTVTLIFFALTNLFLTGAVFVALAHTNVEIALLATGLWLVFLCGVSAHVLKDADRQLTECTAEAGGRGADQRT